MRSRAFFATIFLGLCIVAAPQSVFAAPIRILLVPGHDDVDGGAEFLGVKESDMNLKLALYLRDQFMRDPNFDAVITRNWDGYTGTFSDYFKNNAQAISDFIVGSQKSFISQISSGQIQKVDGMPHNDAPDRVVNILYGINKWANEHAMDAVIHVHFNDYPRPRTSQRGQYSGFVVYTPDQQFNNGKGSLPLAMSIFASLSKQYPTSDYLKETDGVAPDQDLIAIGSNNTLLTRAVLVEYGYIYEKRFSTFAKRDTEFKTMARLTYEGIKRYFDIVKVVPQYGALR